LGHRPCGICRQSRSINHPFIRGMVLRISKVPRPVPEGQAPEASSEARMTWFRDAVRLNFYSTFRLARQQLRCLRRPLRILPFPPITNLPLPAVDFYLATAQRSRQSTAG
jgi:hypothetical protein